MAGHGMLCVVSWSMLFENNFLRLLAEYTLPFHRANLVRPIACVMTVEQVNLLVAVMSDRCRVALVELHTVAHCNFGLGVWFVLDVWVRLHGWVMCLLIAWIKRGNG